MIELVCARLRWVSAELGDQAFLGSRPGWRNG